MSEAELRAIEADQRIRDAELAVRAMHPDERDLTPLLDLLGTEGLRAGALEFYTDFSNWRHAYEVDGQIDVVRQQTRVVSDDEVVVMTCELDWINMIRVDGERSRFRGGYAMARAVSRTFRRADDGSWVNVAAGDDFEICSGVESPVRR